MFYTSEDDHMNETKLSIFHRFFYSITNFDKYRLFLRQSTGKAVVYLLLLTMLLSAAIYTVEYNRYIKTIDIAAEYISEYMPDFRLDNGHLSFSGEMPFVIETDAIPVVIDTAPDAEDRILNSYDIVLLVTSDKLIIKNYIDRSEIPLSIYQGVDMTRDDLVRSASVAKPIFVIILVAAGIFFIISKFVTAFIVSLIGKAVNSVKGTSLSYRSIFKISVYSMTLPLIVFSILDMLQVKIPFMWLLFYIGCGIYVTGVISRIKTAIDSAASDMDDNNMNHFS